MLAHDDFLDGGTLHLHDHRLAGLQPRRVGLGDRGGPDGIPVELGEHAVHRGVELGFELRLHDLLGQRLDRALKAAELESQGAREQILTGGHDLPQLHEDDAALLEGDAQRHVDRDALGRPVTPHARKRQPVPTGDADDLSIARVGRQPPANVTNRARQHEQARTLAPRASPAGPGSRGSRRRAS